MYSFRPLPGDLISQLATIQRNLKINSGFPSPFRGSYFSILKTFYLPVILMPCFRPLSGDLISQLKYNKLVTQRSLVSVPFPGILFLNDSKWVFDESTTVWFPSPSRGSYFSIFLILSFLCSAHTAFPSPSRGSYFSIRLRCGKKEGFYVKEFPSPSRGSYFSIKQQIARR